ncbi:MAG: hypothetical protein GX111_00310 [Clostridiales bacterium]|nr:hypothetical protein [Clostridiales bacterium]
MDQANLTGVEKALHGSAEQGFAAAAGQEQGNLNTGVNGAAAAGQEGQTGVDASQGATAAAGQTGTIPTGAAAPTGTTVPAVDEKAFAARLTKERERIAQETRDSLIAELYGQSHGIKTYEDYQKAAEEYRKQTEIDRLVQQNVPNVRHRRPLEYAEKLMKVDELEKWQRDQWPPLADIEAERARIQNEQAQRDRNTQMFAEFLSDFPEYESEEKWQTIPKEVFAEARKWIDTNGVEGRRLTDAFSRHVYNQTMKQQQKDQANQINAGSSTGSAKGQGTPDVGFISKEVFLQNKNNQNWMMKNYDILRKSMSRWKA